MIHIAICGTDYLVVHHIRRLLIVELGHHEYKLSYFKEGDGLIKDLEQEEGIFQVVLLVMKDEEPWLTEVTTFLSQHANQEMFLVYLVADSTKVCDIPTDKVTRIIQEPLTGPKLKATISQIESEIASSDSPYVLVKNRYSKEKAYILQKNIIYIEMEDSAKRLLKIVTTRRTVYIFSRLAAFITCLQTHLFVKIYRSIYVNKHYIIAIQNSRLCVGNQMILPISRKYLPEVVDILEKQS